MTIRAHLEELERRHQVFETQIATAQMHSSSDDLKIAELKRQKLQLRDEILALRSKLGSTTQRGSLAH